MRNYCVIGKTLPHTLSPQIHHALGNTRYNVVELASDADVCTFVRAREYDGYNVTIPYKEVVMPLLDNIDPIAAKVGAVNTIVREADGKLCGYNTDVQGISRALECANIPLKGRNILILGSGGTCKTAQYVCRMHGANSVKVVSRTGEINYTNCYEFSDTQIIINTTPVGMMPHAYQTPIEPERFANLQGVFDCVYNPLETMLVKRANDMNISAANGLMMLVEQAAMAHNLFSQSSDGELSTVDEIKALTVYNTLCRDRKNIVLIGMAGSGKTAIARTIAQQLGREVIDTDALIEREQCCSIADIFATYGEETFRNMEQDAIERACSKFGCVVSTGGGAILSEKNRFFMHSNGVVVLILRELDKLATSGRPLSANLQAAKDLFAKREAIYNACADIIVQNDDTILHAADKILRAAGFAAKE